MDSAVDLGRALAGAHDAAGGVGQGGEHTVTLVVIDLAGVGQADDTAHVGLTPDVALVAVGLDDSTHGITHDAAERGLSVGVAADEAQVDVVAEHGTALGVTGDTTDTGGRRAAIRARVTLVDVAAGLLGDVTGDTAGVACIGEHTGVTAVAVGVAVGDDVAATGDTANEVVTLDALG